MKTPAFSRTFWVGLACFVLAFLPARGEDPLLGEIKMIKCVNCVPGYVTLLIHDPIDLRDFEILALVDAYNRIVTPLPGKRIHERDGKCFYWLEAPKVSPTPPPVRDTAGKPGDSLAGRAGAASRDTSRPSDSLSAASHGLQPPESQADAYAPPEPTPSVCVPFINPPKPPKSKKK